MAAALRALGIGKGDRVAIYMPTMPEAIIAMLACSRIGAIHLVVFAGFGSGALAERIGLAGRGCCLPPTSPTARAATCRCSGSSATPWPIPRRRSSGWWCSPAAATRSTTGARLSWDDFIAGGRGQSDAHEPMEANEPAFILATSGTTAKPKLAVHTHGGYQVGIHSMGRG